MFLVPLPHPDLPGLLHPEHDQVHLLAQGLGVVIQLLPPLPTIVIITLAESKTNLRMQFYAVLFKQVHFPYFKSVHTCEPRLKKENPLILTF